MNQQLLHLSIEKEARYTFARSGGPGGQNVNKVSTKVFISVKISALEGVSATEKERITQTLQSKLDKDGVLTLSVDKERSQFRNREISLKKIESIIVQANFQTKKRIPTKPGKTATLRRISSKKSRGLLKTNRTLPNRDD